ncbi:MAG: hydrolase [Pseudomonadota bacterium]
MDPSRSVLFIIDVQERLLPAMESAGAVANACVFLGKAAAEAKVPVLVSEQYPKGLGHTVPDVLAALRKPKIFEKTSFSVAGDARIVTHLRKLRAEKRRDQVILCGIEAHVCVLQSALQLMQRGFEVFVAADATSSRKVGSRDLALSRLAHAGVAPVSTEMVAFEWVQDSRSPIFKPVSALVRSV